MTLRLSYSAINTYQTCPLQYRLRYVEGRPTRPSAALSFGHSLHEAVRWFYDVPTPDPPSVPQLVDYLETCWEAEGYSSPEEEVRYFYQGRSALELFHRRNAPDFRVPAALEHYFVLDLGFCELSGVIDRLDKDAAGEFEIIDYKTNRRLPPARKLQEDLQLPIYHMAVENIWGVEPSHVTFYYMLLDHRYSVPITAEWRERASDTIRSVASAIECSDFEARKNPLCPWCDYLEGCEAVAGKVQPRRSSGAPAMDVGQAVDELLSTERSVTRMLDRMEGLKGIVGSYLSEHAIDRVGGSRCIAFIDEDGGIAWRECDPDMID
jgi:RecB family exonuclease